MVKRILVLLLLIIMCDRCHNFINEERGYYICENVYGQTYHQRLDKIICKRCYRLLPTYIQDYYKKVNEDRR